MNEYKDPLTSDLGRFGLREIQIVTDIFYAWTRSGLPDGFWHENVRPVFNTESGYVFLTNDDFQVAMMNGHKLEQYYSTPYEGHEGFADELADLYDEMHPEDQEYLRDLGIVDAA